MRGILLPSWRKVHPDNIELDSDMFYAILANRVADLLRQSPLRHAFPHDGELRDTAMRLTAYFEDICSGIGFWRVVNETFLRRYGVYVPFYDIADYQPDRPNPQDVRLLLWDMLQSYRVDGFINPLENNIEQVSLKIYDLFLLEYPKAPVSYELVDYLNDPLLTTDFFCFREALMWIAMGSYLSASSRREFETVMSVESLNETYETRIYSTLMDHIYTDRHNLIQFTAAEWLEALTGRTMSFDTSRLSWHPYRVEGYESDGIRLHDLFSGETLCVVEDSFDPSMASHSPEWVGTPIACGLVCFNGRYYQTGAMLNALTDQEVQQMLSQCQSRQADSQEALQLFNRFNKYSGHPFRFYKSGRWLENFLRQKMGIKVTEELHAYIEQSIHNHCHEGLMVLTATQSKGLSLLTMAIPAIKSPYNDYYDEEYARLHACEWLLTPSAAEYETVQFMLSNNMLSDAALSPGTDYDSSREFVQRNAQFILDYSYAGQSAGHSLPHLVVGL